MNDDDLAARMVPGSPFAAVTTRIDTALNRVGLRGELARDTALGVTVGVVSAGLTWLLLLSLEWLEGTGLPPGSGIALTFAMIAQSLALCVRRRYPVGCLLVTTAFQVLIVALLPPEVGIQGLAVFIAAYTCGLRLAPLRLTVALVAGILLHGVAGGLAMGALAPPLDLPLSVESGLVSRSALLATGVPTYLLPALIGAYVGTRRRYGALLRLRTAEEIRAQRERAEGAIRAERSRMARELHDIAAHHLSGMVVQAGAAERLVGRDDDAARQAMAWVRSQGKETLTGLRAVVGALRDPEEESGGLRHRGEPGARGAPVPGLATLDRLVTAERELGADIDVVREGDPYELAPIADVTAYRVVQESLSNARDHAAGARVRLSLRYGTDRFVLEVENGAGGSRVTEREHRGLGVLGMRERAQVVGATLDVGPTENGGWLVRWELRVDREDER
ncbi:histidine kinase [Nocardiopsis sp. N85]|uniref:sensor histidine kinase n=1 Tax=Nocardiopsis sp. N85 TaxID=3029400 RepID=UPI00237F889A|nr:histidine kinase [Nocardiopsis sp. N85]MDE3723406.1 histidine kinase [Nocardiopsis sp. N85]